jgi:hypothetical protein
MHRLITRGYFSLLWLMRKTEKGGIPEKQGTFGEKDEYE